MRRRLNNAAVAACLALPVQGVELWAFLRMAPPHAEEPIAALVIANIALLGLLCTGAADYSLAGRAGKAALVGCGVAMLVPGSIALDNIVAMSTGAWDAGTWLAAMLPYVILLITLSVAEAGLYLLATRPTVAR
jgi:hypothetical protein